MKIWQKFLAAAVCALGLIGAAPAYAQDGAKPAPKDLVLKGDARCTSCHDEADAPELLAIGKSRHGLKGDPARAPSCSSCHGESNKHADYKGKDKPPQTDVNFQKGTKTPPAQRNEACLTCHQGGKQMHWAGSAHANGDVTCATCHTVHNQHDKVRAKKTEAEVCYACHKQQRSDANKLSHHPMNEGKVTCSSCHNPHGSTAPKQLVKNTVNETCYSCHAEKRGPFLWEHPPASDDCAICHTPHGSNQPAMLKTRAPFLCTQCHITSPTGHSAQGIRTGADINAAQVGYKACLNCHTQVHGSNHPSGPRFVR